jgi:hypothetical protein
VAEEVDVAEEVVTEKATTISIRNTGRTRLATSVRRRGTLQTSALRSQTMTMTKKSVASVASSVKKLKKDFKSTKKAFTTVNTQLEKLKEADYDLSGSEDDEDQSHFQMDAAIQFAQVDKEFEPTIANLFKQAG